MPNLETVMAILQELYDNSDNRIGRPDTYDLGLEMRVRIKAVLDAHDPADRWAQMSAAFREEHPWCGWVMAFAHGSDWDTTVFGLERLLNLNVLLTTAEGKSRPVSIREWQHIDEAYAASTEPNLDPERKAGILVQELDTEDYEPIHPTQREFIAYEDIREIVVY